MKLGLFVKLMMVLIFLALVANVVVAARYEKSLLDIEGLKAVTFWALVAANLFMAGAGVYFTTRAHQQHEKASIEWGRRGFVVNIVVTGILTISPWLFYNHAEIAVPDAMMEIAQILLLFGVSGGTFLFSFYREYRRNVGDRPRRRTPSMSDADAGFGGGA